MFADFHEIEAEIRYLTTEEGGRKHGVISGYRGQFYYGGDDCIHSGSFFFLIFLMMNRLNWEQLFEQLSNFRKNDGMNSTQNKSQWE